MEHSTILAATLIRAMLRGASTCRRRYAARGY